MTVGNQVQSQKQPSSQLNRKSMITKKSNIFEKYYFYLPSPNNQVIVKILEHSGNYMMNLKCESGNKGKSIIYLQKDGASQGRQAEAKNAQAYYGDTLLVLSPRWVDFCIDRKFVLLDIKNQGYTHLFPFPNQMPIPDMLGKKVCIKGFLTNVKITLKGMFQVAGAIVGDSPLEADFIVVDDQVRQKYVNEENQMKVRSKKWIFDCIYRKKLVDENPLQ